MADRGPAPGGLETVRGFVNTVDFEGDTDTLTSPAGLVDTLAGLGLTDGSVDVDAHDLDRARDVREAIRVLLEGNCGHDCDTEAVTVLNEAASRATLQLRFDATGTSALEPCARGVDGAIGRLLAIVFTSMADGTWNRMKACNRDECRWAFYDQSKNRSSRWCSMEVCGNKEKAKAFRARHTHD